MARPLPSVPVDAVCRSSRHCLAPRAPPAICHRRVRRAAPQGVAGASLIGTTILDTAGGLTRRLLRLGLRAFAATRNAAIEARTALEERLAEEGLQEDEFDDADSDGGSGSARGGRRRRPAGKTGSRERREASKWSEASPDFEDSDEPSSRGEKRVRWSGAGGGWSPREASISEVSEETTPQVTPEKAK